ncbi:MAG: PTS sugar transporter subunit IIA [Fusobacteriaceae bacterium]|jgi:PTS system nitrogen regulatory IIA component|nr:PTS sugar transporter subunit IIA [Fusobacteriaceae bacterium]
MKFSSYLDPKFIFTDVDATSIKEVIVQLIEEMSKKSRTINENKDELTYSALKRENEISTCVGNAIAIPHSRIWNFNDLVVSIGILRNPIEMEIASTGRRNNVKIVFLILCDVLKNKNILKIMSAISKLTLNNKDALEKIKKEKNPNEIIKLIQETKIEIEQKIIAEDVLSPDIIPAKPEDTLGKIVKRLILEGMVGLPVVDDTGNFLGEITEKEVIGFGMPDYLSYIGNLNFLTVGEPFEEYLKNNETTTIKDLYRKIDKVITIDRKTPIMEICAIIINKGITRFYVLEGQKYYGMIKRTDILKKILHI